MPHPLTTPLPTLILDPLNPATENLISELIHAIMVFDVPRARELLAQGIDPTITDSRAPRAWQYIRRTPERSSLIHDAVLVSSARHNNGDRMEMIDMLIEAGCPIDTRNLDGYTPLHNAALVNHAPAAQRLIALGADVNAQSHKRYTPLQTAVAYDSTEVQALLLAHEAQVDLRNHHGENAIEYAARLQNLQAEAALRSIEAQRRALAAMEAIARMISPESRAQRELPFEDADHLLQAGPAQQAPSHSHVTQTSRTAGAGARPTSTPPFVYLEATDERDAPNEASFSLPEKRLRPRM